MRIVQLMASPFYGGPERQMLGMSRSLPADCTTRFLTFAERGRAQALLDQVAAAGLSGQALRANFPNVGRAIAEIASHLKDWRADILCTSGYKPDILGWRAARSAGVPIVVVSHGWTGATWKVRLYERLDRWVHARADAVVAVSEAQAAKVRAAGVAPERMTTIVNAVGDDAFTSPSREGRERLERMFARPPRWIIGAAGRLSPEKGFDQLVAAAGLLKATHPDVGVVIFGDGPLRDDLARQIVALDLVDRVVLAGFQADLTPLLPNLDAGVLPSFTEGLPVVLLEMMAAGVPVVATAVGGIPEVIADGATGWLVPSGNPAELSRRIGAALDDAPARRRVAEQGRDVVRDRYSVERQSAAYHELFERLIGQRHFASRGR